MNKTELLIKYIYRSRRIEHPYQLTIENVIRGTKLGVIYWNHTSEIVRYKGAYKIFIDQRLNERQQWQDFSHELGHCLLHCGSQSNMSRLFLKYQEKQANYFAYHFCVPTFMLDDLGEVTVYEIMNLFNVEYDFALRRFEMYQNKFIMEGV